MSAGDDNFLARWSRRKQAVRHAEAPPADKERHTAEEAAAEEDAEGRDLPLAEAEPVEGEPGEPLPSLEDLTANSDLTRFLRKGVPKALQNAALRKMWSLDPGIRDYVGPSEYAWDFNKAGSMGGFGPLEAKESVAEFMATMSRGLPPDSDAAAVALEDPAGPPQVTTNPSDEAAISSSDQPCDDSGPAEPAEPPQPPQLAVDDVTVATSAPAENAEPAESSPIPTPPRHGGAVPR